MTDALANFATTGKLNFKSFADSVIRDLARIAYEKALAGIFNSVANAYGLTNHGLGRGTESQMYANSLKSANGNVFSGSPGLSAYSGSIVSKPTMFAFASGAGLMGEAGPEAILPLKRGAGGKLGVVTNSTSGDVYVTVENNGPAASVQTKQSTDSQGNRLIKVVLNTVDQRMTQNAANPSSSFSKTLQGTYGLRRAGVPVGG